MISGKSFPPFIYGTGAPSSAPGRTSVTAIIADDEPLIAQHLGQMLATVAPEIKVVAIVHDGGAAIDAIEKHRPTLAFLDIRMPAFDGVEVAWRCRDHVQIIFTTAFEEHAATAFEQGAVDYLRKPIRPERLRDALRRLYDRLSIEKMNTGGRRYAETLRLSDSGGRAVQFVHEGNVQYVKADGNYSLVRTVNGRQGVIRLSLTQLREHLNPAHFVQIHRSCIINRRLIMRIERQGHGAVVTLRNDKTALRATRQYTAGLFPGGEAA